jgi:hypothetical protein
MSILRYKQKLLPYGNPMGGGSGGGGGPTSSRVEQTNIPEYARPYVETMLGATQQQLFNTRQIAATPDTQRQIGADEEGKPIFETIKGDPGYTEITGVKPYVPYSTDPGAYVAGFSPMQQQAFQGIAGMQPSSQLGTATDLANIAGIGSLGAGQQYAQMATSPQAMQAYMSPYMQNVVDYQKSEAMRDYAKQMPALQAQAVSKGAFGGNRLALQQAEAQRNLNQQLQGIQATGSQQAFQAAQQAQQYGANLGLQGYGQALQGAGQLGQLGQTQYGQQMGILSAQQQAGAQQQALEQQKINQAIQNYATAQQYPQQQLAFMNAQLRGLPLQQTTVQGYQAAPSAISQIGGIGAGGIGLYGMGRTAGMFKEGGVVKMGSGGITGMSKKVLLNPEDFSTDQVKTMTDKGMISQLVGAPILDAKMKDEQRMKLAQAAQQPKPIDTIAADIMARAAASQGIDNAESNLPVMSAFDGGIVAMADGGEVDSDGVARYNEGGRSAFMEDLYKARDYIRETPGPNEYIIKKLREAGSYFTTPRQSPRDADAQPGYTPSSAPVPTPPEAPKPRILEDSKPSAAAPAASAPAQTVDTSGKGIMDILKKFEEGQVKSAEKDTEDKKMAFWSTLAQIGFGTAGGTSPYTGVNLGQAATPAIASGTQALREIRGREEKRNLAGLQTALEGEKIKADYAKLGLQAPYLQAMAQYYQRRPGTTGTAGLGAVTPAVADKVMTRFQGYEADPKTAPFFGQLPLRVQQGLTDYKPGTESYRRSMEEFRKYNDRVMQQYLNSLRGLSARTAVSADEES